MFDNRSIIDRVMYDQIDTLLQSYLHATGRTKENTPALSGKGHGMIVERLFSKFKQQMDYEISVANTSLQLSGAPRHEG